MPFEVISCEPYKNSISPALYFNAIIENQWGFLTYGGIASCSVYFEQAKAGGFIDRVILHTPALAAKTSAKITFRFPFSREQWYHIARAPLSMSTNLDTVWSVNGFVLTILNELGSHLHLQDTFSLLMTLTVS